ncbi:MAG TPA: hypothetical protein VNX68_07545 [Nitrosopumilaceae archaeon]|nr:hypothetical protein [Nitrosopumilaceae archaeon]
MSQLGTQHAAVQQSSPQQYSKGGGMIFYEDLPLCMQQTILPMSLISVAAKQSKLEVKLSGDNTLEAICKWDSTLPDCGIIQCWTAKDDKFASA